MSIYSKSTKKTKKPAPSKKPKVKVVPKPEPDEVTEDQADIAEALANGEMPQQQINPMIVPEFFNNIRNNYYVANKIIWLTGEITWENVPDILKRLNFADDDTKEPVTIYISSPGGMCDAGWAIVDMIEKLKSKKIEVRTICAGSCSSMAAVILASGTKGQRYAFPSSRIMIHQAGFGLFGPGGKLDEMANEVRELQYWTDLTAKYFSKVCKKNIKDVQKALSYDNYMNATEAKKFGIIDKVDTVLA